MSTRFLVAAAAGVILAGASPALAQDPPAVWFVGAGVGQLNAEFRPYYTYYGGGTPDQFENTADGFEGQILAGRRYRVTDRVFIALQGTVALSSASWSLSIPEEPADLEYSLPYRLVLSVAPEVALGRVTLMADVGGGMGRVHQLKSSPSSSTYDFDRVRPVLSVGAGIRVAATRAIDLFAHVGHARFSEHAFDTFTPSGVRVEQVTDRPRATGFTVGVIRRF